MHPAPRACCSSPCNSLNSSMQHKVSAKPGGQSCQDGLKGPSALGSWWFTADSKEAAGSLGAGVCGQARSCFTPWHSKGSRLLGCPVGGREPVSSHRSCHLPAPWEARIAGVILSLRNPPSHEPHRWLLHHSLSSLLLEWVPPAPSAPAQDGGAWQAAVWPQGSPSCQLVALRLWHPRGWAGFGSLCSHCRCLRLPLG